MSASIPFMVTRAMKAALHARLLTDEQIAELTPKEAHEVLSTPDSREVREFLTTIVAQARAATKHLKQPGLLQMMLIHPLDDTNVVLYRYKLDDVDLVERMTREAMSASAAGHNIYIEGRTVRPGLNGKKRGELSDTIAVFAIVVDSDNDKGKGWTPTMPTSLAVEISPGNAHYWLFFEQALDSATGQALGERLRTATNADADTGNVCQPYRVAGTVNYPNEKKVARGRIVTWTRSLGFDPASLWTPESFEQEFPAPAPKIAASQTTNGSGSGQQVEEPDENHIAADTLHVIREGVEDDADRSYIFYNVVKALKDDGWTPTGIVTLLEHYPKGIASKYRGRLQREIERILTKLNKGKPTPTTPGTLTVQSQTDFLADFVPPDYLVDGVLQRRFVYSLTAQTGHGKTALALLLARAVGSADPAATFGPHAVEKGTVVYFVGENPDDVRCRLIGTNAERSDDPSLDRIHYIAGVFDIAGLRKQLAASIDKLGGVDLVLVDTSAAYFLKDDENSNPQMGEHARMLRSLTTLPGGPCVVTLCHPIKHVTDPSQLVPRGGGAFIAEMDGNLTAWLHDETLVTLHHNKIRGPGFEPITFKLEKITTTKLVDSKKRLLPTVHAVAITEAEEEERERQSEDDEDVVLAALSKKPRTVPEIAHACGWQLSDGKPYKSKVKRTLDRLLSQKLVEKQRGHHWRLTDKGKKQVEDDDDETERTVEDRAGAVGSKKTFHALRGMKQGPTVPCIFCGQTGEVYKFADGRLPKGQRHHTDLHAGCAEPFFTGKPKPAESGPKRGPAVDH
jgi:hypothetical protein